MTSTLSSVDVALDVTPLSAHIGAELRGLDLRSLERRRGRGDPRRCGSSTRSCSSPASTSSPPSTSRSRAAARRAHRGPPGDPRHRRAPRGVRDRLHAGVRARRAATATSPSAAPGLSWHTDVTFVKRPPRGFDPARRRRPRRGGDTLFSEPAGRVRGAQPVAAGLPVDAHRGARRRAPVLEDPRRWSGKAPGKGRSSRASSPSSTRW